MHTFNKIFIVVVICFFSAYNLSGQSPKFISIGIAPSGYIDPVTPSLVFHIESTITYRYQIDLAYGLNINVIPPINWKTNYKGKHHEYKVCLKRMFSLDPKSTIREYIGLEYFGVMNNYSKKAGQFTLENKYYLYDSAEVDRQVNGLRLKVGLQKTFSSFGIEGYCGVGFRHLSIKYDAVNERLALDEWREYEWFTPRDIKAGSRFKLDLNIGFKIYFLLWR